MANIGIKKQEKIRRKLKREQKKLKKMKKMAKKSKKQKREKMKKDRKTKKKKKDKVISCFSWNIYFPCPLKWLYCPTILLALLSSANCSPQSLKLSIGSSLTQFTDQVNLKLFIFVLLDEEAFMG